MKTLIVLLIGAALGIGGYIYFRETGNQSKFERAGDKISESAGDLKSSLGKKLPELDTEQIKKELSETGRVVQKKAKQAGDAIADATADARMTAAIKGKYALESDLSALSISVNTTKGIVTLSGTVSSHDNIKKAMRLAIDTDGVTEVISTLQVKTKS